MRNVRLWSEEEFKEVLRDLKEASEKALREDPRFNPNLQKGKTEKAEKAKRFEAYNWTTHEKKTKGLRAKIKALKEKPTKLTDQEELTLRRMKSLLGWHEWALKQHNEGWSDKRIHEATLRLQSSKAK